MQHSQAKIKRDIPNIFSALIQMFPKVYINVAFKGFLKKFQWIFNEF